MSAGGVFKIIANDGKADRMIMATDFLNQRIKDIMCIRSRSGYQDPTPTLVDIEKTHLLFINAHFKPFAAIGYEYNKVRVNGGTAQYDGSIQFSIPQFGDFFNDMVINMGLSAAQCNAGVVPAFPPAIGASDIVVTAAASVSADTNPGDGVYTKYTYEYVDIQGNVLEVGDAATNFTRYAELPGQRIFKKVKFDVNGNPLDDYTAEAYMYFQKFQVAPNKMTGWKRLVGQEVPIEAYSDLMSIAGTSPYANAGLVDVNGRAAAAAPVNGTQCARRLTQVVNGPQTPKLVQPALDLWIPLIFWFNRDPRLSVASVSIPYGHRFITVDIAAQNKIVFPAPGNLFLRLTTEYQFSAGTGAGTAAAIAVTDALARNLTPRELAGVLAHEISHIAHEDVKVMAFADMVSRFTSFMSTVGLFSLFFNLFGVAGGFRMQVPWLGVAVLLAAPTIGGLLQMALSRTREFDADLGAVTLTGDPDGLASALGKLERAQGKVWENVLLPSGRIPDPSVLRTHPLTADRVARLRALKSSGPAAGADGLPRTQRPPMVPRIPAHASTYFPHGARGFINAANSDLADDTRPACEAPLNPAEDSPRIRVTRGGVWW